MSTRLLYSEAPLVHRSSALRAAIVVTLLSALAFGCTPPAKDGVARGEELFKACASCHGEKGGGKAEFFAPKIAGLDETYVLTQLRNFKAGHRAMHPDDLYGHRMNPMARNVKTDKGLQSLAKYVATLSAAKPTPSPDFGGDPAKGKALYATCMACHGMKGEGNTALKAPALSGTQDWYLLEQLKKFDGKIRGYTPADVGGSQMTLNVKVLGGSEQNMRDVVAYITTLNSEE